MAEATITSASDNTSEITSEPQSGTVEVAPAQAQVTITAAPVEPVVVAANPKAQLQAAIEALEAEVEKLGAETKSFFHVYEVKSKLQSIITQAKTLF